MPLPRSAPEEKILSHAGLAAVGNRRHTNSISGPRPDPAAPRDPGRRRFRHDGRSREISVSAEGEPVRDGTDRDRLGRYRVATVRCCITASRTTWSALDRSRGMRRSRPGDPARRPQRSGCPGLGLRTDPGQHRRGRPVDGPARNRLSRDPGPVLDEDAPLRTRGSASRRGHPLRPGAARSLHWQGPGSSRKDVPQGSGPGDGTDRGSRQRKNAVSGDEAERPVATFMVVRPLSHLRTRRSCLGLRFVRFTRNKGRGREPLAHAGPASIADDVFGDAGKLDRGAVGKPCDERQAAAHRLDRPAQRGQ